MNKNNLVLLLLGVIAVALIFTGIQLYDLKGTLANSGKEVPESLEEYKMTSEDDILIPEENFTIQDLFKGEEDSLEITQTERGKPLESMDVINYVSKEVTNIGDFSDSRRKIVVNGSLSCPACIEYLQALHELIAITNEKTDIYFLISREGIGTELEITLRNLPKRAQEAVYLFDMGVDVEESEFYKYGTPYTRFINGKGEVEVANNGWMAPEYWHYVYLTSLEKRMPYEGEIDYQ